MAQAVPLPFASWQNFYEIVGSSAGALTGLQFVVLALIAQSRTAASMREIRAFGTPTVIHFCSALFISALVAAPWQAATHFSLCVGVYGGLGTLYSAGTFWHAKKANYNPDLEDWFWYNVLPLIVHLGLVVAAVLMPSNEGASLWGIAAAALLFLLLGIHNAWDTVTYIVVQRPSGNQ